MKGKGILRVLGVVLVTLAGVTPGYADETADDITNMLTWWDEFGSDWEDAKELIEFAATETDNVWLLADNTMEAQDEKRSQQD